MQEVRVDRDRCVGHGVCALLAPDHFVIDAEGKATVAQGGVPDAARPAVEDAIDGCPAVALSWLPARS